MRRRRVRGVDRRVRPERPGERRTLAHWHGRALVTLVTTALLLKGPEKAADLPVGWRLTLTILLGLGLALAIAALWRAPPAAAGEPGLVRLADLRARRGTVTAFRVAQAQRAAVQLTHARWLLVPALSLLVADMLTWWWAPANPAKPLIGIDHRPPGASGTRTACGELASADASGHRATSRVRCGL